MNKIEEINTLSEQILNQQALTDAKQLGLQACTIAAQLAVEVERLNAENKRMTISLDEAMDLISRQFKTLVAAMSEDKRAEFTVALMQSELSKEREPQ